ncbi:MAG: hypothetical protein KBF98_04210 [Rhodoferax sp.]|jgi:hypothetical protein|nr:hypothetical protein [Rhodoferax sp.]
MRKKAFSFKEFSQNESSGLEAMTSAAPRPENGLSQQPPPARHWALLRWCLLKVLVVGMIV